MTRFAGRVALVSGAGSGIGAAVAAALVAEGASVGAFDVDAGAAAATAEAITASGGRALPLAGDTRSDDDVRAAVRATADALGGLDLIAAIAGVLGPLVPIEQLDGDAWDRVLETNVKGPFLLARHGLPELRQRGGGAILTTTSVMAFTSVPGAAAYSASKGALVALTHALAVELAPDRIRVNTIAPGVVDTPMNAAATSADEPRAGAIEPREIARLALFLLSDEASAITGTCVRADGGLLSRLPS